MIKPACHQEFAEVNSSARDDMLVDGGFASEKVHCGNSAFTAQLTMINYLANQPAN
jgi:hypothetical protein